jgi:transposase
MPWRAASPMDQRTQFIADFLRDALSITELCALYGVSRKTGYKWIDRYLRHGPAGLKERSRRPRHAPNQTADELVAAILDARRRHPTWGGKKLLALLHKRHPRWDLPGRSTACDILSRHGMVPIKRRRRRIGHPGKPTSPILAPNDVWSADYKGQFLTGDRYYCYPLTVADGFSRYLLGCQALATTAVEQAKPVFTRLFQEYGLPKRIRTDNGVPFATNTLARLSTLSAWWVRLGILPELIEPGRPAQNGRHERMPPQPHPDQEPGAGPGGEPGCPARRFGQRIFCDRTGIGLRSFLARHEPHPVGSIHRSDRARGRGTPARRFDAACVHCGVGPVRHEHAAPSTFTSSSTITGRTRPRSFTVGWCVIPATTYTSPRRVRRGSTWSSGGSRC